MFEILVIWFILCFLSFGLLGINFILMRRAAMKPWELKINRNYRPNVSIVVPTLNESHIINWKLMNLSKTQYPKDQTQIIIVDSNSEDGSIDIVDNFVKLHPENNIEVIIDRDKEGKSNALNLALKNCKGDIIIVSDADCFWPPDILMKALPFLSDPNVGAITGPKLLLNSKQSWVTETEDAYLNSMNLMKLGQSKLGLTLFFEGGFSAYKKSILDSFDPYNTGSDDCGTIIRVAEKKLGAIMIPEAHFYTTFPVTWKGKIDMKIRRSNQIIRVLWKYAVLLSKGHITTFKMIIIKDIINYLLAPIIFFALVPITILLLSTYSYFILVLLVFIIPKIRILFFEIIENYTLLFLSFFAVVFNKKFLVWNKPDDRVLFKEELLREYDLI